MNDLTGDSPARSKRTLLVRGAADQPCEFDLRRVPVWSLSRKGFAAHLLLVRREMGEID